MGLLALHAGFTETTSIIFSFFDAVAAFQFPFKIMQHVRFLSAFHRDLLHVPELGRTSWFISIDWRTMGCFFILRFFLHGIIALLFYVRLFQFKVSLGREF
jgi:hypothetical protein